MDNQQDITEFLRFHIIFVLMYLNTFSNDLHFGIGSNNVIEKQMLFSTDQPTNTQ